MTSNEDLLAALPALAIAASNALDELATLIQLNRDEQGDYDSGLINATTEARYRRLLEAMEPFNHMPGPLDRHYPIDVD